MTIGMKNLIFILALLFVAHSGLFSQVSKINGEARDGILVFESEDEQFKWWFDARVQIDGAYYFDNLNDMGSGLELRRGRFALKTKLWGKWHGEFDIDVADNEIEVKDVYIRYNFNENTFLRIGNFKEPFGIERPTTSRHIIFLERSYANAFTPGRQLGGAIVRYDKNWYGALGFYGQGIDNESIDDIEEDDGYAITGRVAFSPFNDYGKVLHFGISGTQRTPYADGTDEDIISFRTRAETHVSRNRYINTGYIRFCNYFISAGAEAAAVYGPFSIQGEYIQVDVDRKEGKGNPVFNSGYVFVTYTITGESRPYNNSEAEFLRIIPENKYGAFELAARYSYIDMNDFNLGIYGGAAESFTLGLNWYANRSVKMMANYTITNNDRYANGNGRYDTGNLEAPKGNGGDDFSFFQVRFEIDF